MLVFVVPSKAMLGTAQLVAHCGAASRAKVLVSCSKGIELETGRRMTELIGSAIPGVPLAVLLVLVGWYNDALMFAPFALLILVWQMVCALGYLVLRQWPMLKRCGLRMLIWFAAMAVLVSIHQVYLDSARKKADAVVSALQAYRAREGRYPPNLEALAPRDMAVVRARLSGAPAVLVSATPSLESFANVERGKFRRLELPERIDGRPMPVVELVDLNDRKGEAAPVAAAIASQFR